MGDQGAFAVALARSQIALATVDGPAGACAKVVLNESGQRVVLAFTSPQTAQLWDEPLRIGVVPGADLPATAREAGAEVVAFDPAGPSPVEVGVRKLTELLDGIVEVAGMTKLVDDLQVRFDASMHQVFRSKRDRLGLAPDSEVYLLSRQTPTGAVVTVLTADPGTASTLRETVPRIALAGQPVDIVTVDSARSAVCAGSSASHGSECAGPGR